MIWSSGFGFTWRLMRVLLRQLHVQEILENPEELALNLMNSSSELSLAIKAIREALKVVEARGVNLKLYKAELLPYENSSMDCRKSYESHVCAKNELTRKNHDLTQ